MHICICRLIVQILNPIEKMWSKIKAFLGRRKSELPPIFQK